MVSLRPQIISKLIQRHPCITTTKSRFSVLPEPMLETQQEKQNAAEESSKATSFKPKSSCTVPAELRLVLPDFMPEPDFRRRHPIAEKLERMDMLRRRQIIEIPEFYVGSIMAVTVSDEYAPKCSNRFVGICIARDDRGLRHHMTLRNVVDGNGVEVQYNLYNPLIQKIEVLRLEKRLDEQLFYLRDAEPEYSTIPFNIEPIILLPGTPVPVNTTKVKLRPPPWSKQWQSYELKGVEDFWPMVHSYRRKKFTKTHFESWRKYDIVAQYQKTVPRQDHEVIFDELVQHERSKLATSSRRSSILAPFQPRTATALQPKQAKSNAKA